MPKRILNAKVMGEILSLANNGELAAIRIHTMASGKTAGQLRVNYTKGDRLLPEEEIRTLSTIALKVQENPVGLRIDLDLDDTGRLLYEMKETITHDS